MRNEAESASGGESKEDPKEKKRKTILIWEGIALALMIIGLIILGYFTYRFYVPNTSTSSPLPTPRPSASKSSSPSASACASTLTSTDKTDTNLWKTYTNSKYNYSFKYPQTWIETSESTADEVIMKDSTAQFQFRFMAASVSISEAGYTLINESPISVACVETTIKEFRGAEPGGENMYILSVQLEKGGNEFRIPMNYVNRGASMTGDIVDAYYLILKTVEFK